MIVLYSLSIEAHPVDYNMDMLVAGITMMDYDILILFKAQVPGTFCSDFSEAEFAQLLSFWKTEGDMLDWFLKLGIQVSNLIKLPDQVLFVPITKIMIQHLRLLLIQAVTDASTKGFSDDNFADQRR